MKTLMMWIVALVTLAPAVVHAQDVTGTWQGTLQAGRPLRLVIQISNADGGGLRAVMYSIDQGGQGAAATVALQGTTVRIAIAAIGGGYEGRLSADGNALTGTFTQGGMPLALNLARATSDTAWTIPAPPAPVVPMAANADPAFEVATIKPSNPDAQGKIITVRGRQVITINTTLNDLITFAYGLHARQITTGPAWLETEKYDVTGLPDTAGQPSTAQLRTMVQKLLADRFKLAFHRDKRELAVYALVVGAKGPMLTRSAGDPNGLPAMLFRGPGALPARNVTMADFASVMQAVVVDRPVVDQTGLSGRFDFTLTWTPDESQFATMGIRVPPPTADASAPPGLFTAIHEQLGLKFDSTRAPVDVMVVDRVERPSEN
ncbi:MAG: hypothetical protein A3G76_17000 [Acidobacteria bacterium RIFCSPLOWO2_12_FULL_65_11]|nr:MAG: hypothetical protein A3H95_15230 [Acidobacteria bacterium RIFCSPLOWO2_02_FULL_64_15]OFW33102.1 MAG: hypothetical protein A3G76_17000 [Acidobacteria bacterium RIFCSPLOWO2_12_FULL_65_11]